MTDFNFVPTKLHQSGEFAVPRGPRRRDDLGLGVFTAPRAFTSGAPHPRLREQENHSANSWQNASNAALALGAPFHFATLLGGRLTSM
ncbi:conserved hypothetical protein [Nitrosococcus halophilus Nc 4]|uniref:Uncharacterized protein n=1 Tax=Nitrosococcus halophilus (strain Nc4) TaxID=472759 RepID=D5C4Z4_NITHN|nr:conserved hypothetical protein [Nitrosococcus halophilus Nc 4]